VRAVNAATSASRFVGRRAVVGAVAVAAVLSPAGLGRAAAPAGRYSYPAAGTVLDLSTHLTWQQGFTADLDRTAAIAYCKALALAGGGWRLPTFKELFTLVDESQPLGKGRSWVDDTAFPGSPAAYFWSATPTRGDSTMGLAVYSYQVVPWAITTKYNVRCAR
jgi:hypothetical protein